MPKVSSALTVNENGNPVVTAVGALTERLTAGPALTATPLDVPVKADAVSVAVTVWLPAVLRVTGTVFVPFGRVESAGKAACASELVKWTAPVYPGTGLFPTSRAVTTKLMADPAFVL